MILILLKKNLPVLGQMMLQPQSTINQTPQIMCCSSKVGCFSSLKFALCCASFVIQFFGTPSLEPYPVASLFEACQKSPNTLSQEFELMFQIHKSCFTGSIFFIACYSCECYSQKPPKKIQQGGSKLNSINEETHEFPLKSYSYGPLSFTSYKYL